MSAVKLLPKTYRGEMTDVSAVKLLPKTYTGDMTDVSSYISTLVTTFQRNLLPPSSELTSHFPNKTYVFLRNISYLIQLDFISNLTTA